MRRIVTILMISLLVTLIVGCGGEQPQPQPQPQPTPTPQPRPTTDFAAIRKQLNNDLVFKIEVFNFPPDQWNIQESMAGTLDKLANILQKIMKLAKKINSADKIKITVVGYSDTSGTQARKMRVSENRSKQVIKYLVEKRNFAANIFRSQWRGDQELKNTSDPLSGQNRRVVVIFEGIRE